ncbi:hypothetical protein BDZ45DRAFT_676938 [Acephala macrosclerotiorum]|nr:hypothetical protein BDZ45DRAFT_676938 [Acephala macrosclerotiorum]
MTPPSLSSRIRSSPIPVRDCPPRERSCGRLADQINRPKTIDEADEVVQSDWENELKQIMPGGNQEEGNITCLSFSATFLGSVEACISSTLARQNLTRLPRSFGQGRNSLALSVQRACAPEHLRASQTCEALCHLVIADWAREYCNVPNPDGDQEVMKNNPGV